MNATCPRCGTIILAAQKAKRLDCPTCQARYCPRCQHWKENKQKYCLDCHFNYSAPLSAIHESVMQSAVWGTLAAVFASFFYPGWSPWLVLIGLILLLELYFAVYLVRFERLTRLRWAARRQAVVITRQGIIWISLAYFMFNYLKQPARPPVQAFVITFIGALAATGLGLFVINRLNAVTLDELRAQRDMWKAVLAMKSSDALLMRFPSR